MAKKIMGVEIGNYRIKLAVCVGNVVEQVVVTDIPENMVRDGVIISWEAMAGFIKETVKENNIKCKYAALVLPDTLAYIRHVSMPAMTVEQLKVNLPYEFHDYITEERDKYIYDYALVDMTYDDNDNPKEMDLMAVAAKKETVEKYNTLFKHAGLKLVKIAPTIASLENIINRYDNNSFAKDYDYAIFDIGHTSMRLHFFTGGRFEITRNMEPGCQALTNIISDLYGVDPHIAEIYKQKNKDNIWNSEEFKNIYNRISVELMRVVNFYFFNHPDSKIDTIYYCGGGAKITPLLEEIQKEVDYKLVSIKELLDVHIEKEDDLLVAPLAIGITW